MGNLCDGFRDQNIEHRKRPAPKYLARDQETYSKAPQVHHVKINSQNQLVILGFTNHRVDNLMFSSHIYLIKKIHFYFDHFILLTETGAVWVCGSNENNKIGLKGVLRTDSVVQLELPPIDRLTSDGETCILHSEEGEAYFMGKATYYFPSNTYGVPTRQHAFDKALCVVIREQYSFILNGNNVVQRLTNSDGTLTYVCANVLYLSALKECIVMFSHDAVHQLSEYNYENISLTSKLIKKEEITQVVSSDYATLYTTKKEKLKLIGELAPMFYGSGKNVDKNVTHVDCGKRHAVYSVAEGSIFGVGSNLSGQLGHGSEVEMVNSPTEIKWKDMFPDGMHYFSNWNLHAIGCSQCNTYLWLSK